MGTLPTASPLQTGQPVYVALVPGVRAEAGHFGVIQSGWTTADAQEIHELSRQVLQLAMVNCVVAVTFRVVALVLMALQGRVTYVVEYASPAAPRGAVPGAATARPRAGHLTAFYSIYIVFSVLAGISVLFCVVTGLWGYFVVNALFLALYSVTADNPSCPSRAREVGPAPVVAAVVVDAEAPGGAKAAAAAPTI
ncbi:ubiquitin-protein transferase [Aureococcus anophagefferens]|nr:ubiquitin-protein transferase [Aureococcus anophagefferens]